MTFAGLGLPPALDQQGEFLVAADDCRHFARVSGCEPAFERTLAEHREDGSRLGDALEGLGSQVAQHEQVAREVPGRIGDNDHARLGDTLQPSCEIGRLAHDGVALPRAFADQVAHHDHAGSDADAGLQILRRGRRRCRTRHTRLQPRGRGRDGQCRAHRTLGVVFMRSRPAEIGEHAVAEELRDMALEARDLAGHCVLVRANQLAHVFRVELGGQRRRADQVDKHHGELAAFGG